MKNIAQVVVMFFAAMLFIGCGAAQLSPAEQSLIDNKSKLYTQVPMWTEKGKVLSTNYMTGTLIPVNSEVTISSVSSKDINFVWQGQEIALRNIPKFSGVTINKLMARTFATSKVDLSKFDAKTRENILKANAVNGMSKDAVLLSRGYPPKHKTPTLESNSWRYWVNRWNQDLYNFKNGKLTAIVH